MDRRHQILQVRVAPLQFVYLKNSVCRGNKYVCNFELIFVSFQNAEAFRRKTEIVYHKEVSESTRFELDYINL